MAVLGDRRWPPTRGTVTWRQYGESASALALAYHELGVRRGDVVGIHQRNRVEHVLADTAAILVGATPVSLYNTLSPEQLEYVATDTGMRLLVVEAGFLDSWKSVLPRLPRLTR